jgi:hypothetical protein
MIVLEVLPIHVLLHVLVVVDELELGDLWNFLVVLVDRVLGQLVHSNLNRVVLVQRLLQRPVPPQHRRVVRLSWHVELVVLQVVLVLYHLSVHLLRLLAP